MTEHRDQDPFRPSPVEAVLSLTRLPWWAAASLAGGLLGSPGLLLTRFLGTGRIDTDVVFAGTVPPDEARSLLVFLWFLHPAWVFGAIPFMRRRIAGSADQMVPLLRGGRPAFERAFAGLGSLGPAVIGGGLFYLLFAQFSLDLVRQAPDPGTALYQAVRMPILCLAYGSFAWLYLRGLLGIYRLGGSELRLESPVVDPHMGAKPFGSLALALAFAFFGLATIMTAIAGLGPVVPSFVVALTALPVIGGFAFFVPLRAVHGQMEALKKATITEIRQRIQTLADSGWSETSSSSGGAPDAGTVAAQEAAERLAARARTWPMDTGILGRLAATLAVPIAVAVITRAVIEAFGL